MTLPIQNQDDVWTRFGFGTGKDRITQFQNEAFRARMSTITVVTAADGVPTWPQNETDTEWVAADPNNTRTYSTHAAVENTPGAPMSRIIAGGFEVHNDTPELYKSGSVTVYSMPQNPAKTYFDFRVDNDGVLLDRGGGAATLLRMPPTKPDAARSLRNARTWDAKQGVLVPFRVEPTSGTMEFTPLDNNVPVLRATENMDTGIACPDINVVGSSVVPGTHFRMAAMETSGAYFSGLSYDTVLTLTTKFFVESAPTSANQEMLALASPPAVYNPDVLACYEHCMRTLPAGVPVGLNEKGDWWRMVLKTLREAVPLVVPTITKAVPQAKPFQGLATSTLERGLDLALQRSEARAAARRKTGAKQAVKSTNTNLRRTTKK